MAEIKGWQYLKKGEGEQTVLVLTGALGVAESAQQVIHDLSPHFRVIAPSYPPVPTMAELVDGIAGILEREGVRKVHVFGSSYGGLVAQVFLRRHPEMVDRVVIAHTGYPDPERGPKLRKALRLLAWLPWPLLRAIFRRQMAKLLPQEAAEARAHIDTIIRERLTKKALLATYGRAADLDETAAYTPQDLTKWPGRMLIICDEDDPSTPPETRQRLAQLYPAARWRLFRGTGHATAYLQREEYMAAITSFLLET